MKYRDLNVLVCPECKSFPLKMWIIEREKGDKRFLSSRCERYCAFRGLSDQLSEINISTCEECQMYEIRAGLLLCNKCKRWYPIFEGVPVLFKAAQRNREVEKEFLKKYGSRLPKEIKVEE